MKWAVVLTVTMVLAAFVLRAVQTRRQVAAAAAAPASAPQALDLGAGDVFTARTQELTRTLAISGGLRAATSAVVKAKVASEIKSLTVREGDTVKAGQVIGVVGKTGFATGPHLHVEIRVNGTVIDPTPYVRP
jgi:multidrug efflux pump subunit AcrA (membrane-fusion protein)